MTPDVSVLAAFVAGTLSITSPCVLPLIPLYLAHLAGAAEPGSTHASRQRLLTNAMAYVLGFSLVFVMVGVAFGAAGSLVSAGSKVSSHRDLLVRAGGVLIVILGLHQIGVIRIPFLQRERRLALGFPEGGRALSSFLVGVTFAAGWSPCAGPILGAILTMAAGEASVSRAAFLLAIYSAGLALPFLAFAVFGGTSAILRAIGPRLETISSVSGGIMIAMGLLMLVGLYQQFFTRLVAASPWSPWEPRI